MSNVVSNTRILVAREDGDELAVFSLSLVSRNFLIKSPSSKTKNCGSESTGYKLRI